MFIYEYSLWVRIRTICKAVANTLFPAKKEGYWQNLNGNSAKILIKVEHTFTAHTIVRSMSVQF
jgi:hypothetical protein